MKEIITEHPNLYEPNVYITMCVEITGKICLHKLTVSGCKTMITDKNWIELVRENEKIAFTIDKGELVRTIMIMAHHLAGDGKSILYFIRDIMNALAEIPLTYKPLVLLTRNSFPEQSYPYLQNYIHITANANGRTAISHDKTIMICIISIGNKLR